MVERRRAVRGLFYRHSAWVYQPFGGGQLRQRGNRHLRLAVHVLPVGQVRQDGLHLLGLYDRSFLLLYGEILNDGFVLNIALYRVSVLPFDCIILTFRLNIFVTLAECFCNLQVSAWGGYVFIINLIPLHVFALILMGRYSNRLFTSYTTFYVLGLLLSMQIPFVGFQPIRTSEHMAASGKILPYLLISKRIKHFILLG